MTYDNHAFNFISFNPPLNTPPLFHLSLSGGPIPSNACWVIEGLIPNTEHLMNIIYLSSTLKYVVIKVNAYANNTPPAYQGIMSEIQSPKEVVVTLSFYNWTNPYTGWSWELYNVTSPFTQAMVEETLKAMNITPTPPSQVMINGNNATLVFNNIPFGTTINITLPGGSYEGSSNCWQSIFRNPVGYYEEVGIPNPISIQAYTNMSVDYIVVYNPTPYVCSFTP
ncbi:hypothetical protein [Vulcanisaeta distributa]|uniref:hypothetical protein n=1 Tax=Vulcanisaeta distributa TaxID=164451 RepID=UPI000A6D8B67|nr:hypothetical protein [Vulcanisaeta distributa]